jgi:hypothetical protein
MSKRISSVFLFSLFLLAPVYYGQQSTPVIFTTQAKTASAKLISAEKKSPIEGMASFTVAQANDDDTITGTLVFTISEDARVKLAEFSGADLEEVPAKFSREDVTAQFLRGTSCPTLHLKIPPVEMEAAGITMKIERMMLDIAETQQQMSQLFCAWSRQINARRHRRGIIKAINRLINPEEEEREFKDR